MSGIHIPDTGRLLVDVLPLSASSPEVYPRPIIRAWRTVPDAYDVSQSEAGLNMFGETSQGEKTRQFFVPQEAVFRGVRENLAAIRISFVLLRGKVS